MPKVICPNGTLEHGPGHPTALICDQMRVIDQPPIVLEELSAGWIDILVYLARWSYRRGVDILPIMIDHQEGLDRILMNLVENAASTPLREAAWT